MCVTLAWHAASSVRVAVLGLEPAAAAATPTAASPRAQRAPSAPVIRSAVLSADEWLNNIRSEKFWARRRSSNGYSEPSRPAPPPMRLGARTEDAPVSKWRSGSYRTVCVRLCDGYYFPISASVSSDEFDADAAKCASSCSAPARLFVYRNGSEEPSDMVDLDDKPYSRMKTAFLYRTAYDASCKCKPHPWEEVAMDRHRLYALKADVKKGKPDAAVKLAELERKLGAQAIDSAPHSPKSRSRSKERKRAKVAAKPLPRVIALADEDDVDLATAKPASGPVTATVQRLKAPLKRTGGKSASTAKPRTVKVSSRNDDWRRRALGLR